MKITRETFGYQSPKDPEDKFAQCETCIKFTGKTCLLFSTGFKVQKTDSCNEYLHGKPQSDEFGNEQNILNPSDAGFVRRQVRCENCAFANVKDKTCGLYNGLNRENPTVFDLDVNIEPKACCNAQTDKKENSVSIVVQRSAQKIELKLKEK